MKRSFRQSLVWSSTPKGNRTRKDSAACVSLSSINLSKSNPTTVNPQPSLRGWPLAQRYSHR